MSVVAEFYRTCVIDGVLEHWPAEYVRRPTVPGESPTLGLTHLHFEALLNAAKDSANRCDFALVTMLGLLGLRTSRPPAATLKTLTKSTMNAAEKAEFGGDVRGAVGHCQPRSCRPDLSGSLTFEAWPEGSW
jgi:hypothetical protein